jgi:hypothetical protein
MVVTCPEVLNLLLELGGLANELCEHRSRVAVLLRQKKVVLDLMRVQVVHGDKTSNRRSRVLFAEFKDDVEVVVVKDAHLIFAAEDKLGAYLKDVIHRLLFLGCKTEHRTWDGADEFLISCFTNLDFAFVKVEVNEVHEAR